MKKTASVCLMAASVLAVLFMSACKSVPSDELKASIEITDVDTKWVSKYYQPWPPRLILVPVVSFRVKNVGTKPLQHVNFNAIFKFKGDPENLGDNFLAAIRSKAVNPGRDERGHHPEEQLRGRGQDPRLLQGQRPVEAHGGQDLRPVEGLPVRAPRGMGHFADDRFRRARARRHQERGAGQDRMNAILPTKIFLTREADSTGRSSSVTRSR